MDSQVPEIFDSFGGILAMGVIGSIIHLIVVIFTLLHLRNLNISDVLKFYWCAFIVLTPLIGIVAYAVLMGNKKEVYQKNDTSSSENQFWACPKCTSTNPNNTFVCTSCGYSLR